MLREQERQEPSVGLVGFAAVQSPCCPWWPLSSPGLYCGGGMAPAQQLHQDLVCLVQHLAGSGSALGAKDSVESVCVYQLQYPVQLGLCSVHQNLLGLVFFGQGS